MLDFMFGETKKYNETTLVVLVDDLKQLKSERLVKKYGKNAIEALKSAIQAEDLKNEVGKSVKTFVGDKICFLFIVDDKNPFRIGKMLYNTLKKYLNAKIFVEGKFSSEFIEKLVIGMENANYSFDKYMTKKKAEELVQETEITRQAKEYAMELIQNARAEGDDIIAKANADADKTIAEAEEKDAQIRRALSDNLNQALSDAKRVLQQNLDDVTKTMDAVESLNAAPKAE